MQNYSKNNSPAPVGIHRVRDPKEILFLAGLVLIGGIMFVYVEENNVFTILCESAALWAILRLRAIWNGVEIDYDRRILSLPGGGISANSPLDYLNPIFLMQYFLRKSINLDEIRSISDSIATKIDKNTGSIEYKYLITITGKFGGITLTYSDENKRDELYALIREANQMGTPFVRS